MVIRQVTARRAQGALALEDVGSQVLKGVADPTEVFRLCSQTVGADAPFLGRTGRSNGVVGAALEGSGGCVPEQTPGGIPISRRQKGVDP